MTTSLPFACERLAVAHAAARRSTEVCLAIPTEQGFHSSHLSHGSRLQSIDSQAFREVAGALSARAAIDDSMRRSSASTSNGVLPDTRRMEAELAQTTVFGKLSFRWPACSSACPVAFLTLWLMELSTSLRASSVRGATQKLVGLCWLSWGMRDLGSSRPAMDTFDQRSDSIPCARV